MPLTEIRPGQTHSEWKRGRREALALSRSLLVEQANVYELVVNQNTARALGITLPQILLLQATRMIE